MFSPKSLLPVISFLLAPKKILGFSNSATVNRSVGCKLSFTFFAYSE